MKSLPLTAKRVRPKEATAPAWLHEGALDEWNRLAPTLTRMGVLDETTAMVFAGYCNLAGRVEQMSAEVDKVGLEAAISCGLWEAEIDAGRELLSYCEALLLTPAARAKAAVQGEGA